MPGLRGHHRTHRCHGNKNTHYLLVFLGILVGLLHCVDVVVSGKNRPISMYSNEKYTIVKNRKTSSTYRTTH